MFNEDEVIERAQKTEQQELKNLHFCSMPSQEIREISELERSAVAVINSISLDSFASIISPRGLDFKTVYDAYPVVCRGHRSQGGYEIGSSAYRDFGGKDRKDIISKTMFAKTDRAEETFQLVKQKVLRGTSIGGYPTEQYFGDEAKRMFEEDYKDLNRTAPKGLKWYIRGMVATEYAHLGTPSNMDAQVRSLISGMSEDTQMFVMSSYYAETFPKLVSEIETLRSQILTEKQIDDKLQAMLEKMTIRGGVGEKPIAAKVGDGEKPLDEMVITRAEAEKFIEYKAKKAIDEKIKYALGKHI